MFIILWLIIGVIVGAIIGDHKGRAGEGAVLGLILGPIGWLIVALGANHKLERETRKCPFCAELVKREATICKHCHRELTPVADQAPAEVSTFASGGRMMAIRAAILIALIIGVTVLVILAPHGRP